MEEERAGQGLPVDIRKLLGGPRIPAFDGSPKSFKNWLAILDKSRVIYGLSDQETLYLAYDATRGKASEYIKGLLASEPHLTWERLEELLTGEFADGGTAMEAMRALLKMTQLRDETTGELGARAEKLSSVAFPDVKNNAVMQAQLADLYVEALSDERIRHDVLKEGPLRLSASVALSKESLGVWEKAKKGGKIQELGREVGRKGESPRVESEGQPGGGEA